MPLPSTNYGPRAVECTRMHMPNTRHQPGDWTELPRQGCSPIMCDRLAAQSRDSSAGRASSDLYVDLRRAAGVKWSPTFSFYFRAPSPCLAAVHKRQHKLRAVAQRPALMLMHVQSNHQGLARAG
jgi:hypothetical protein